MKQTSKLNKALKVIGYIAIALAVSFIFAELMVTGMIRSNMMMTLAAGKNLEGVISDKLQVQNSYRLVVDVNGFDTLNYTCSEDVYNMYNIGDEVVLGIDIVLKTV